MKLRNQKYFLLSIMFVLAITVLTLGFVNNQWQIAEDEWFKNHQRDTESNVVGRLAKSRQDGIFSAGGLTGRADVLNEADNIYDSQYLIYLNNLPVYKFNTYNSQIGFQAMFFGFLDQLTNLNNSENLAAFKLNTALLAALVLAIIIVWVTEQFGLIVGIFVLISTTLSQWLVVFGSTNISKIGGINNYFFARFNKRRHHNFYPIF